MYNEKNSSNDIFLKQDIQPLQIIALVLFPISYSFRRLYPFLINIKYILNTLQLFHVCSCFLKFPHSFSNVYLFYLTLACWVFIAAWPFLSLQRAGSAQLWCEASHCGSISCGAQARGCSGFSICSAQDQQLWLLGSRAQAQQFWHLGLTALQRVGPSGIRDHVRSSQNRIKPRLLNWQADPLSLSRQGSPHILYICILHIIWMPSGFLFMTLLLYLHPYTDPC